jgi:hypothetical protein
MPKPTRQIDVYRDWLKIADPARPLDYYAVLKLKRFQDDPEKIRDNYRKLNAHVRRYATGEFGPQSQALLNELARAMLCLTDQQRKDEYDASLGRVEKREFRRRSIEQILLAAQAITLEQLNKVRNVANAVGLSIRDAILQQRIIAPEIVMQAYAESVGLPYIDLEDIGIDESLVPGVPAPTARENSCVPVMIADGMLLLASPNPLVPGVEDDLRLRFGVPARTVLCTPASINALVAKYYSRGAAAGRPAVAPAAARPAAAAQPAAATTPAAQPRRDEKDEEAEEEAEAATPEDSLKRKLAIAWIVFMGCVILYVAYRMIMG